MCESAQEIADSIP